MKNLNRKKKKHYKNQLEILGLKNTLAGLNSQEEAAKESSSLKEDQ